MARTQTSDTFEQSGPERSSTSKRTLVSSTIRPGKDVFVGTAWTASPPALLYNPAKGNVRESRNVIFIETPPTLPGPAPASGLTDGEFTYEDDDDLLRDVMDYTSYLDLDSPADHGTVAPSALDTDEMRQLVTNIREITDRDLLINTTSPASPGEVQIGRFRRKTVRLHQTLGTHLHLHLRLLLLLQLDVPNVPRDPRPRSTNHLPPTNVLATPA